MPTTETIRSTASNGSAPPFADMLSPKLAFGAWRSMLSASTAFTIEALHFGSRRLEAQAEFLANLLTCKDAAQAFENQSSFMRRTLEEYGRETEAIVQKVRDRSSDPAKAA
ncbi:phasin family protein [Methylopila sp. 73B]|uniref:phasin family protein n=1 Tax=Methylopila sp. 73B TaxID=1120792 RepID=UPI000376C14B|nr:phasin family protein [Methylopila sp. 73B]